MKVDNNNLLTKLAGLVGVTSASLLMGLPANANEVLNPSPSIFSEAPYNRTQRVIVNTQNTASESENSAEEKAPRKDSVVQKSENRRLNPNPKILQECPYNRAACPGASPNPTPAPEKPAPETPTSETPAPETPAPETPAPEKPSSETPVKPEPAAETTGKNIVALAESNSQFSTLVKALKAAGLVETLQGKGPFTVFAPTNEAFAKLPKDAVEDLFKPENKEVLVKILTYHVVPGQVLAGDLKSGEVKSVEGGAIKVEVGGTKGVMVNDAKVITTDVKASNGVIHAIDNVILPPDL
ncbi:fasciclin domain-containing protein [Calothrix sp. 336/3]|uniref:fasciclin domain-containing protein n=1 Tax=Calothrix sp. 336/3 TaxID=1337936 RepID=UPI0004E44C84|nr:fasciclin domain-containing protein [Calothrix sp. 336/3]AKG20597.1 beta-Ig-H3/fasciclin [Calothrix sp. 336/3]